VDREILQLAKDRQSNRDGFEHQKHGTRFDIALFSHSPQESDGIHFSNSLT
jgi:hypothetical protein